MRLFRSCLALILIILCVAPRGSAVSDDSEKDRFVRWQTKRFLTKDSYAENLRALREKEPQRFRRIAHLLEAEGLRSPLFMDEKRVAFIQPDGSFTLIELQTWSVVARTRSAFSLQALGMGTITRRLGVRRWLVDNKVLIGTDQNDNSVFFRLDTGEHVGFVSHPLILSGGALVLPRYGSLEIIDTRTLSRTDHDLRLPRGKSADDEDYRPWEEPRLDFRSENMIAGLEGRLYFLSYNSERKLRLLQCRTLPDFRLDWSVTSQGDEGILGFVVSDGRIHVFFGRLETSETRYQSRCTMVRIYDAEGNELERVTPTLALFGGDEEQYFAGRYTYDGIEYNGAKPATPISPPFFYPAEERVDQSLLREISPYLSDHRKPLAAIDLPGGGRAWIAVKRSGDGVDFAYRDASAAWDGAIRTVGDWLEYENAAGPDWGQTAFLMAANDEFIVYASRSGKMECMERSTGKSRWIYLFSSASMVDEYRLAREFFGSSAPRPMQQHSLFGWGPFFTDIQEVYWRGLSPDGILPLQLADGSGPASVPVTVDPKPDITESDDVAQMRIILWMIPLASLLLVPALRYCTLKHFVGWLAALLIVNFLLYGRYGGYSRPTTVVLLIAMAVLVCAIGYSKKLCKG